MNLWSRFASLVGQKIVLSGIVVDSEFRFCTIQLPNGSEMRVEGAGTTGKRYYITQKDDGTWRLDREANNLPMITIEI
jgi:hypothetical protein